MTYYLGYPNLPEVQFVTGEKCTLVTDIETHVNGVPSVIAIMSPEPFVIEKYGLANKLSFKYLSSGTIMRVYSKEYWFEVTNNPEYPLRWVLCGFDGEEVINNKLSEFSNKLVSKDKVIADLKIQLDDTHRLLKTAMEKIKVFEST